MHRTRCQIIRSLQIFCCLLLLLVHHRPATGIEWIGAEGDFNDSSNWQGGNVPEFTDEALINNGGTAQFSTDADVQSLRLGVDGGLGTFVQTDGLFLAVGAFIGDNSQASATISGGEFTIGNDSIHVGWSAGGVGELTIQGADTVVTSGDDFQLGREGTGTLNFSDGQLRAGYTVIGKFGTGTWNQTGGMFDQDFGDVEIGDGGRDDEAGTPGPRTGTLNLSGGFLQTADHLAIGNRRGSGVVNVSGGRLIVTGNDASTIYIGRGADTSPGAGGDTALRVIGGASTIVANGDLLMNPLEASQSSTLIAEITGTAHTPILIAGNADVASGSLKVELNGYTPQANDNWLLVQTGVELDDVLAEIDNAVDAAGYEPLSHGLAVQLGEVLGPFASIDTSLAPLPAGMSWDVAYTETSIVLSVLGTGVLTGDFNANGVLDAPDIDALTTQSASANPDLSYDLNSDNLVNVADVDVWVKDLFNGWIGDANLDGEFNSSDLVAVLATGTYEVDIDSVWSSGDFNGDGRTNSSDLVAALADGGYETGPRTAVAAVPEPAGASMLVAGLILLAGGIRRARCR